jgi:hypothetical protein
MVAPKALFTAGIIAGPDRDKELPMQATWVPLEKDRRFTKRSDLPETAFAFPRQRKEPLIDARHVRNAAARFDQVIGVSSADRAVAFSNIQKAADYYNVEISETSWRQLGVHPQRHRRAAAAKAAATRRRRRSGQGGSIGRAMT